MTSPTLFASRNIDDDVVDVWEGAPLLDPAVNARFWLPGYGAKWIGELPADVLEALTGVKVKEGQCIKLETKHD